MLRNRSRSLNFTNNLYINLLFYFIIFYIHTQSHPHILHFPFYPLITRFLISGVGTHILGFHKSTPTKATKVTSETTDNYSWCKAIGLHSALLPLLQYWMGRYSLRAFPGKARSFSRSCRQNFEQAVYISIFCYPICCFSFLNFRWLLFVIAHAITPFAVVLLFCFVVIYCQLTASKFVRAVSSCWSSAVPKVECHNSKKSSSGC